MTCPDGGSGTRTQLPNEFGAGAGSSSPDEAKEEPCFIA